ncbi:hypothetical protein AB6A40_000201 [Gnathostoma spinigerum]|uniref:Pinin/SDK/MemA protein domain-containing protein n=1 Tax=Gnathostoma spinigerum TaxID=75299 RepID=A0ABD6EAI8_9BILA
MGLDDLTADISKAYDDLRNIDDSITALVGRGDRGLGGSRRRIMDGSLRVESGFGGGRRDTRVVSLGEMGISNKRRITVSAENDFYDEKRSRLDNGVDEEPQRRSVQSSIVMPTIETKTREAAINELKGTQKKEVNIRNRRMFSNLLLGTLQRFQRDEKKISTVEKTQANKQREVEKRLRDTELEEKERLAKERLALFEKRRETERRLKSLQRKKAIIQYAEQKQEHYRKLQNFIQTQAKPPIFYLPSKHTLRTLELLKNSTKKIDELIEHRRLQMESDLGAPEAKEGEDSDEEVAGPVSSVHSVVKEKSKSNNADDEKSAQNNDNLIAEDDHKEGIRNESEERVGGEASDVNDGEDREKSQSSDHKGDVAEDSERDGSEEERDGEGSGKSDSEDE